MSGDERYYLGGTATQFKLPASTKPSTLRPTAVPRNLVRARGHTRVIDLSDGLPDPAPIVLTARVVFPTERELSAYLAGLHVVVRGCTSVWRGDASGQRGVTLCQGGDMVASPIEGHSGAAEIVISLVPSQVSLDHTGGLYF